MSTASQLVRAAVISACAALAAFSAWVLATPLPVALSASETPESGQRFLDRHGRLIRTARVDSGSRAEWVPIPELSASTIAVLLAAEDKRFYWHPGIDPIAVTRALGQLVWHRRAVSGASTLTQQLARTLQPRPRTLRGKAGEAVLALRMELSLGKNALLEQYVNRVDFGPNVRGIGAASRLYFDKPAGALSVAEAATLVGMVRGPSLYDPTKNPHLAHARRDRVLRRAERAGLLPAQDVAQALAEPLRLQRSALEEGGRHFLRALRMGALDSPVGAGGGDEFKTSLDFGLQIEVERLARRAVERLGAHDVSAAAVVVLDNRSGDVLAYVGSAGFFDQRSLGQNDGVLALRQPGSTLKPFVYATAMERLGYTAATILPDIELHLATAEGDYRPKNYNGRQHGPVRLREALSNSLNIPAVLVASRVGPTRVLATLRRAGFDSLTEDAAHYGAAIALGDGEVRLLELAAAYTSLANAGRMRPPRFVLASRLKSGQWQQHPPHSLRKLMRPQTAAVLFDVLSDPVARAGAFGRGNVLELPFAAAVKTGTSKGHRDNLAVGVSGPVTVAVWVGNFDGRPMIRTSGVTGAGPLFRQVMMAAMRGRNPAAPSSDARLVSAAVCERSGQRPGPHCTHTVTEKFASGNQAGRECDLHRQVWVDADNGLLSAPGCPRAEQRVVEVYAPRYRAWAKRVGRPIGPQTASPRCPRAKPTLQRARIAFPYDGARFLRDPALAASQQRLSVRLQSAGARFRLSLDGRVVAERGSPTIPLSPGHHRLVLQTAGGRDEVAFVVD